MGLHNSGFKTLWMYLLSRQLVIIKAARKLLEGIWTLFESRFIGLILDTFWFAHSVWAIMSDRNIPADQMDGDENRLTFCQVVPMLLLISTVFVLKEAYDDITNRKSSISNPKTDLFTRRKSARERRM